VLSWVGLTVLNARFASLNRHTWTVKEARVDERDSERDGQRRQTRHNSRLTCPNVCDVGVARCERKALGRETMRCNSEEWGVGGLYI